MQFNKNSLILLFMMIPFFLRGQENNIILFGIVDASPPFMFINEGQEPDGFAVDLYTRMMGDLEIPYEIRVENFNIIYKDLIEGTIDLFPGMLYSKEREEILYFPATPLITSWGELCVAEDTFYTDIVDIKGKTVGMVKDDLNGQNFITFMKMFDIPYKVKEVDSFEELFAEIKSGNLYGGISSNQHQMREPGIKPTTTIFSPSAAYAVTGREKGNIPITDKLSDYLKILKDDPQSYYYELEHEWYGAEERENLFQSKGFIISLLITMGIFVFLFLNITYLRREVIKQVEEKNLQIKEQEKVALKNNFLASVSHELRTPMNIITNMTYLHAQTDMTEEQRIQVEKISKASRHLVNIINNFLDFNRLENNRITQEKRAFSPRAELEEIIEMFLTVAREKSLKLNILYENQPPPVLWGDSFRMTQILTNLISNAIKFSEKGTITLSVVTENQTDKECWLSLSLKDQGIGIASEKIAELFKPYSQVDNSISRRFGGSGLGLTICRQLVELLGGTIMVSSQEGVGTEFKVTLPFEVADREDLQIDVHESKISLFPNSHVLFVEDNPINREIGLELLKRNGIEAIAAENGSEALNLVKNEDLDLIFMDIQMPEMDGLTATRKIRALEKKLKKKPLPIIALTAHFLQEDIQEAYEAGMNGHLSKPVSIEKLNRELEKWLQNPQVKDPVPGDSVLGDKPPIPGVNMPDVMDRFGGERELLYSSIDHFMIDYGSFTGDLLSHKSNIDFLQKKIHSLRGVLGSLGMNELAKSWQLQEELINKNPPIITGLQEECRLFDDFMLSLKKWIDS